VEGKPESDLSVIRFISRFVLPVHIKDSQDEIL